MKAFLEIVQKVPDMQPLTGESNYTPALGASVIGNILVAGAAAIQRYGRDATLCTISEDEPHL